MSHTGAVGAGSIPFVHRQLESLRITLGSWATIVIGTWWFACSITLEGWWSHRTMSTVFRLP